HRSAPVPRGWGSHRRRETGHTLRGRELDSDVLALLTALGKRMKNHRLWLILPLPFFMTVSSSSAMATATPTIPPSILEISDRATIGTRLAALLRVDATLPPQDHFAGLLHGPNSLFAFRRGDEVLANLAIADLYRRQGAAWALLSAHGVPGKLQDFSETRFL